MKDQIYKEGEFFICHLTFFFKIRVNNNKNTFIAIMLTFNGYYKMSNNWKTNVIFFTRNDAS